MLNYVFIFIIGTVLASFIHVYVTRLLRGESIISPRSHCINCNHALKWYELIPIISYIMQKGKCKKCGSKIGIDSLLSEILLGTLFVIVYARYGASYETLIGFVISCMLLSIFISDFKEMIILDSTLISAGILYYVLIFLELGIKGVYKSFLYGIFGFVLLFVVKIIGDKLFKRESLGGGDIKLAFIMGSILPYNLFLLALICGSTLALPYAIVNTKKTNSHELSFGPFLTIALFIVFLLKDDIINLLNMMVEIERVIL